MTALLPRIIDNTFRGRRIALWLFGAILLMKTGIALGVIVNGRQAAQEADGIPLDSFGATGAAAFLTIFALWGLAQLVFSALGILALARYRAMVPLLFALFLFEHAARRALLLAKPIATVTASGFYINIALILVMALGLALALYQKDS